MEMVDGMKDKNRVRIKQKTIKKKWKKSKDPFSKRDEATHWMTAAKQINQSATKQVNMIIHYETQNGIRV